MIATETEQHLARYTAAMQSLAPDRLDAFVAHFAPNGRFIDPFSEVTGHAKIHRVFEKMYEDVSDIRFEVGSSALVDHTAFVRWRFICTPRGSMARSGTITVEGMSEIRFDDDGLVELHHDFWDAGGTVLNRIPLFGRLVESIRRRIGIR